ncbi:hypothetical protein [uncultured Roseovarius sp.]|nr:hypothetical protein [uncultured Roseovarius sp.]
MSKDLSVCLDFSFNVGANTVGNHLDHVALGVRCITGEHDRRPAVFKQN